MDSHVIPLKRKLARNELTIGSWVTLGYPAIAEIMARAGFDWLAVDLEHTVITIREAEDLIRAMDLRGAVPLARMASGDPDQIKRVMDAGAHGVIVPLVNTRAQAEKAVAAVHYPPRGTRGVGLGRAAGYGARFKEYYPWVRENAVVIVMIEHHEAVRNIDSILSVEGVDGYIMGLYDLSSSLGQPGRFEHPEVRAAVRRVREAAAAARKPGGLHIVEPDPAQLRKRIREGFKFLACGMDIRMIDVSSRGVLAGLRKPR